MDERWLVRIADVEAFLELQEDGDLPELMSEILARAQVTAAVTDGDDGLTVTRAGQRRTFDLPGSEPAEVLQSMLELAAHLVAEHGYVLAFAGDDNLELAVVERREWEALPETARAGFAIVEPQARTARPRPPRLPRVTN